ncbi:hypothetical protein EB796_010653 [Bugula neritina]|uniref:Uncharacterized protein n=1 Tax=Bugula neritina TaxID=10212 RepID=A0A7J7JZ87_BUGNE|nr:hypothetical protein EB796_010653 [Bugula neritina]
MEVYKREEGYVAGNKREKLDMYLTYAPCGTGGRSPRVCATRLIDFAENNNFDLNIKAARPYYENERQLGALMAYPYCTVEAFRKKDYIDLAEYLGRPLSVDWERIPDLEERDEWTRNALRKVQRGEYDLLNR